MMNYFYFRSGSSNQTKMLQNPKSFLIYIIHGLILTHNIYYMLITDVFLVVYSFHLYIRQTIYGATTYPTRLLMYHTPWSHYTPANKVWGFKRNHAVCMSVRLFTSCTCHNFLPPCPIWIIFHKIVVHDPRVCHNIDSRSYLQGQGHTNQKRVSRPLFLCYV